MCMMFSNVFFKLLSFYVFVSTVAQKSNHKFLGCYSEENLLSLGDESRILTPISPQTCSEFCIEKHYIFFIVKNEYDWVLSKYECKKFFVNEITTCYCNKNYVSRLMKHFDSNCNIKCKGDNSASCGGIFNFVSLYVTDTSKFGNFKKHGGYLILIYLGCFAETPNDDENRLLKGPVQTYDNNTLQKCSEICFKMGYLYFGVTYGSECLCGNQQPTNLLKVEDSNCNFPCSGDTNQFCGGRWKMEIYSTGMTDYEPNTFVGCFEIEKKLKSGQYLSYQMGLNNSPKRCMNLCNTQLFQYAFIKGNICECKNYEPELNLKRSSKYCNTSCSEDPSEHCGGGILFQSIYKAIYSEPREEMTMRHIGCIKNSVIHPVLNGWKITVLHLTPKYCVQSCFSKRFPYAALISSKECLCSFTRPFKRAKTEANMCDIPCSGAQNGELLYCGGSNAMGVYSTGLNRKMDAIGNYYLGCFEESQNNRIFNNNSKSFLFLTNTSEFCSKLCYKFGYTHSGVTYKSECICGSLSPDKSAFTKLEDHQCNSKCSGDANQYCGGSWRMGIFATGLYDLSIEYEYVGCFVQENTMLLNKNFELINTNTPRTCSEICYNAAYQFAGVIGINCLCTNNSPNDDRKFNDSECNSICVGNSSETCGGGDRIQIYNLKRSNSSENSYYVSKPHEQHFSISELNNFTDEFEFLNLKSYWSHEIYIPQDPDYEFVFYNNSEQNTFVKNGELVVKPTIVFNKEFVTKGSLVLNGCTKNENSDLCSKEAVSHQILPPIMSAKLTTKNSLFFRYGELEIIAKLPSGDWILTEIALVSKSNEKNKLVLATLFGNKDLKCNETDESAKVLRYGIKIDQNYQANSIAQKAISNRSWTDDYHTFELSWTPGNVIFKIDGKSYNLNSPELLQILFNSKSYLSIGVSVGSMKNFPDNCLSNGYRKPWSNNDPKAMLNFWKSMDYWAATWNEKRSILRVKSVKFKTRETSH